MKSFDSNINPPPTSSPSNVNPLGYQPLEPLTPIGEGGGVTTLPAYLSAAFKLILTIGALIAVATFIIGGVTYMTSESTFSKSRGKERIWAALIGLLIIVGSYLILTTINPCLVTFNIGVAGRASCNALTGLFTQTNPTFNPSPTTNPINNSSATYKPVTCMDASCLDDQQKGFVNSYQACSYQPATCTEDVGTLAANYAFIRSQEAQVCGGQGGISKYGPEYETFGAECSAAAVQEAQGFTPPKTCVPMYAGGACFK